ALAGEPDVLPGLDAFGNFHVEGAIAHRQRARAAFQRCRQVDDHARMMVGALFARPVCAPARGSGATEQRLEEFAGVALEGEAAVVARRPRALAKSESCAPVGRRPELLPG